VRRERPHPGAQLGFTDAGGWRFQTFATDTPAGWQHGQGGQIAQLEARHRAHARVEDRIRCAKTSGVNQPPSREFAINQVWLELTLIACDLLAWAQAGPSPLPWTRCLEAARSVGSSSYGFDSPQLH
jgi:hypothetical protein